MLDESYLKLAKQTEIEALKKITLSLSAFPTIDLIVFFGSRARGDFEGDSDMDLLVVIEDIGRKNKVIGVLHDIELDFGVPISPVIFTSREYAMNKKLKSAFVENIEKEGVILYDSQRKRQSRNRPISNGESK